MKITLYAIVLSAALSTAAFAADYSGTLMDAACQQTQQTTKTESCNATSATTSFELNVEGKMYRLNAAGNTKAAAALKDRADRSSEPGKAMTTAYTAKVTGTESNGTIDVESIEVQ